MLIVAIASGCAAARFVPQMLVWFLAMIIAVYLVWSRNHLQYEILKIKSGEPITKPTMPGPSLLSADCSSEACALPCRRPNCEACFRMLYTVRTWSWRRRAFPHALLVDLHLRFVGVLIWYALFYAKRLPAAIPTNWRIKLIRLITLHDILVAWQAGELGHRRALQLDTLDDFLKPRITLTSPLFFHPV